MTRSFVIAFIWFNAETLVFHFLCALGSPTAVDDAAGWPVAGVPGARWSPEGFAVAPVSFAVLPLGVLLIIYVIMSNISCSDEVSRVVFCFSLCVLFFLARCSVVPESFAVLPLGCVALPEGFAVVPLGCAV